MQTIKTGRHMGVSRPILPPMPWHFYRNLTEEDLRLDLRLSAHDPAGAQPGPAADAAGDGLRVSDRGR